MQLIAPFYKGPVLESDTEARVLMDRKDPATGSVIDAERYVKLVQESSKRKPELIQNIARTAAAALLVVRNKDCKFACVDGTPQIIGNSQLFGSDLIGNVWKSIPPEDIARFLPVAMTRTLSDCTVVEARALVGLLGKDDSIVGVTHGYHAQRTGRILAEEERDHHHVEVMTPEQIADETGPQPYERFMVDVIRAASPDADFIRSENRKERFINGPLHTVSHLLETLSGGSVQLEVWLAKRLRRDIDPTNRNKIFG